MFVINLCLAWGLPCAKVCVNEESVNSVSKDQCGDCSSGFSDDSVEINKCMLWVTSDEQTIHMDE